MLQKKGSLHVPNKKATILSVALAVVLVFGLLFYSSRTSRQEPLRSDSMATENDNKPTKACALIKKEKVQEVLGFRMERLGGTFGDKETSSGSISNCIYKISEPGKGTLTFLYKTIGNKSSLSEEFSVYSKQESFVKVELDKGRGIFSEQKKQLIVNRGEGLLFLSFGGTLSEYNKDLVTILINLAESIELS